MKIETYLKEKNNIITKMTKLNVNMDQIYILN